MPTTQSNIKALSPEQKIGQLFFIGLPGASIDAEAEKLLTEIDPGGVCLFSRNIKEAGQTRALLDAVTERSSIIPFLSIDQEGGLVERLRRIMTPMPAANRFNRTEDTEEFGEIIADALLTLGFNMNFAPVVDVIDNGRESSNNGMYSRAFGRNSNEVCELAGAFLTRMQEKGIIGCVKHFPGLGAASADSHEELPQITIAEEELFKKDLAPYRKLFRSNLPEMVMVAHAAYPNIGLQETDQNGRLLPSSLSSKIVTNLLRKELGFGGVAITDDMEMGAIVKNYGIGEACKMAVSAGNDMLAICAKPDAIREGFTAVLKAFENGELPESRLDDSLNRIASLKQKLSPPKPFDQEKISELSERTKELTARLS